MKSRMDNPLVVWILLWARVHFYVGYCQFVTTPRNALVFVGDSVTLDCTIQNAGTDGTNQVWKEYIINSQGQVITSENTVISSFSDKYEIVGQYNLRVISTALSDGGTYGCEDVLAGTPTPYFVELVILESDPVMTSTVTSAVVLENIQVEYTCEVSYQGKLMPVMEWTNSAGNTVTHRDSSSAGYRQTSISFAVGISNQGDFFSCRTYFEAVEVTEEDRASNSLSYSKTLQSDVLQVHYKPRQTQITDLYDNAINRGSNILGGSQIRCQSVSNPPVEKYVWRNTQDSQVLGTNAILKIEKDFIGEISLQCLVSNYMGDSGQVEGTDTVVVSFNVISSDSTGTGGGDGTANERPLSNGEIIGIALGVAVFLAIVIVVTIVLVYRRRDRTRTRKITEEIRINEDGEEEVIRRIEEIVEPAAINNTMELESEFNPSDGETDFNSGHGNIYGDNTVDHHSHNSGGSETGSVVKGSHNGDYEQMNNNDTREANFNNGRQTTENSKNTIIKFADDDTESLPPYIRRGNLGSLL